jgi:hypothetical protein
VAEGVNTPGDARRRPSDPAGTQPKVDPATLLPRTPLTLRSAGEAPDAEGVVEGEAVEEGAGGEARDGDLLPQRRPAAGLAHPSAPPAPPHQARFHFLYGVLAALAATALVVLVAVAVTGGRQGSNGAVTDWSAWQPTQGALGGAGQIAAHVEQEYRLAGRQLVTVGASAMDFEGIPLTVAIRETPAQGGDIRVFDSGGFIYRMCGLGPSCSVAEGKASAAQHLLLQREALELALYSFRYLQEADQVAVLLPPPRGQQPPEAVFFRRGDVLPELNRPLTYSLRTRTPTVANIALSPDTALVDRLTSARLFTFSLEQANTENRGFLVLDPLQTAAPPAHQQRSAPTRH